MSKEKKVECAASFLLGLVSLPMSLIPFAGILVAIAGMALGAQGRQGIHPGLATFGIVLNLIGLVLAMAIWMYGIYLALK